MSIKHNVLANYAAQIYVTVVGIVIVPAYLRYMGAEAYGLVGFFTMMQAWFNLLDMGLSPTLARETARFRGGASDALTLRRLLRALEMIFATIAICGALAVILLSDSLAGRWLKVETLGHAEVGQAIMIMAVILALRWLSSLYRAAITGFEHQVWLSSFNIAIASARFLGVLPVMHYVGATPAVFFTYNLIIAAIELTALALRTYGLLPHKVGRLGWSLAPIRNVLKFSLTLAFTSTVWVAVTQTDKLLLSKLIGLSEYAYFTIAVLVASGITILGAPIVQAFQPRLAKLAAEQDEAGLVRLYRTATQAITAIAGSAAIVLAVFAEKILWAWTGDAHFASTYADVLALYAAGNGFLTLAAFPYYLQFAKGDMRLHLLGNIVFVIVLIPAIILATTHYGVIGAGSVWAITNAAFFLLWTPLVHGKFVPGLNRRWLMEDVFPVIAAPLALGLLLLMTRGWPMSRSLWICFVLIISCCMVAIASLAGNLIRPHLLRVLKRLAGRRPETL